MPLWIPNTDGTTAFVNEKTDFDLIVLILRLNRSSDRLTGIYVGHKNPPNGRIGHIGWVGGTIQQGHDHWDETNTEFTAVMKKFKAGGVDVHWVHTEESLTNSWPGRPLSELKGHLWDADMLHPFHTNNKHLVFNELIDFCDVELPSDSNGNRPVFTLNGTWRTHEDISRETTSVKLYTRDDETPGIPNVEPNSNETAFFTNLSNAGWTKDIQRSPRRLWVMCVEYNDTIVEYDTPKRHYRVLDSASRIRVLARQYHTWESALTDTDTHASFATTKKWWRGWIGRCWAEKPFNSDIRVFYVGDSANAIKRDARDVADWMVGHMEEWLAKPNGISDFRTDMNQALIQTQLDDQTFCHVKLTDGGIGDRLSNGADGLTEAQFAVFQNAKYTEALGSIT